MDIIEINGKKYKVCPKCNGYGSYQRPLKENRIFGEMVGCTKCNRRGVIEIKDIKSK